MSADPRAKRYTSATVAEAVQLSDLGWSVPKVRRIMLERNGEAPTIDTLLKWTSPQYAQTLLARQRRANARQRMAQGFSFQLAGSKRNTPEYRAEFIRRLSAEGVPSQSIAKVCRVVLGVSLERKAIAAVLAGGSPKRLAAQPAQIKPPHAPEIKDNEEIK